MKGINYRNFGETVFFDAKKPEIIFDAVNTNQTETAKLMTPKLCSFLGYMSKSPKSKSPKLKSPRPKSPRSKSPKIRKETHRKTTRQLN